MVFLDMEKIIWCKFWEVMLVWKIEKELFKEKILELYLNIVYFGFGVYGVVDVVWVYFSKLVFVLILVEMVILVGLFFVFSWYLFLVNLEIFKFWWNLVLREMEKVGLIFYGWVEIAIVKLMIIKLSVLKCFIVEVLYFVNYI